MRFSKINVKIHVLVLPLFILLAIPMIANALPAFPGAMGWGSVTIGGRYAGVKLYKVNTLADGSSGSCSGNICTGTLRYALTASGPRIVIFTVGGTITLQSSIWGVPPYLTVAGQTAPGGGILIRGPGNPEGVGPSISLEGTHDIIIRGLRIRDYGDSAINVIGSSSSNPSYNVIIDHNSLSWSLDGVLGTGVAAHDTTYSWNILSEGTPPYPDLMLISSTQGCDRYTYNVSVHHNLFAHTGDMDRAPLIKHDTNATEVINNLIYNWNWMATWTMAPAYIAKNHYIKGANTQGGSTVCNAVRVGNEGECPQLPTASVMVSHNTGPCRPSDTGDDWLIVSGGSSSYRTNTPYFTLSGITEDDVSNVKTLVLAGAGATAPSRDSVDIRIVNDVNNGTGGFINHPNDVGGWPTIASGTYPTDTDGDGIPNTWETARGLNPNDPSDWNKDRDGDGYLNIEEYINSFFPAIVSSLPPPFALTPNPPSIIGIN